MDIKALIEQELKKGTSMRRLAGLVGVSLGTIQNILLADTEIKKSTLDKFSRYFKLPVYQIPQTQDNLLEHIVKMNDIRIKEMQASIDRLYEMINQLTKDLGTEIGDIKKSMLETAKSGDIKRLDIMSLKGPSSVN